MVRRREGQGALICAELDRGNVKGDFLAQRRTDLWDTDEHRALLLG